MTSGTRGRKRLGKAQYKVTRRQPPAHCWSPAERQQFAARRSLEEQRSTIVAALNEIGDYWHDLEEITKPLAGRKDRAARALKSAAVDIGDEADRLGDVARDLLDIVLAAEERAWR